ncbi:hypothetical protein LTSEWAN_4601, partial [Salmonella enterica subsp. enterica serovar Wandsworth str. A4-580]
SLAFGESLITRETVATETPASRATSFMVAMIIPIVGKRLHYASFTENERLFKPLAPPYRANVTCTGEMRL